MSEPFIAEIKIVSFNYAPKYWASCDGQLLPISQNQALFSLLGITFGGNGQTTFALPDLRGRIPLHASSGHVLGERAGAENHTLINNEMPAHGHTLALKATSANADLKSPAGSWPAYTADEMYSATGTPVALAPAAASNPIGGNQPHENMQPGLTLNFVIALIGIFPSRN